MIRRWLNRAWVPLLGALTVSCSSDVVGEQDAIKIAAALETLPVNGVPVPVRKDTQTPVWNGTYPELLAADALAKCWWIQPREESMFVDVADGDAFLQRLIQNMTMALPECEPTLPVNGAWTLVSWTGARQEVSCNMDPQTRAPKEYALFPGEIVQGTEYQLPSVAAYEAAPGTVLSGSELEAAHQKAQKEVQYAWLNLCMAQSLREHLESVQVALASEADLLQLQALVRERASRAVFQYTTIIRTINGNLATTEIRNPWQFPILIRNWREKDSAWSEKAARLGEDFALAVQLLVESSEQHTKTLVRSSGRQPGFGEYRANPNTAADFADTTLDGPRVDALATAYGPESSVSYRGVVTDMTAPEIGALLGLARRADALRITGAGASGSLRRFHIATNATDLLDAVERYVRQQDCERQDDMTSACYQIPGGTPTDQYLVRERFNIQLPHAETLIKALLQHMLGGPIKSAPAYPDYWSYHGDAQDDLVGLPLDLPYRLSGTHAYSGDFSDTASGGTLTLDSDFVIRPLPPSLTQSQAWMYLPKPEPVSFELHPHEEGYGMRNEANSYTRGGRVIQGLPFGTQGVLAYARAAASRAHPSASEIIAGAGPELWKMLEAALGSRSAVIKNWAYHAITTVCAPWTYTPTGGGAPTTPTQCRITIDSPYTAVYFNTRSSSDPLIRVHLSSLTSALTTTSGGGVPYGLTHYAVDPSVSNITGETVRRALLNTATRDHPVELIARDVPGDEQLLLFRGSLHEPVRRNGVLTVPFTPVIAFQRPALFGRFVSYGGALNEQIARAWSFQEDNWSEPRYDALDLPSDWTSMGDASLHGGQEGEEVYQYFLRTAESAAREATTAIDHAFELLNVESQDALALEQAEERGKTLTQLEEDSLCGAAANGLGACTPSATNVPVTVPSCPTGVEGFCTLMRDGLLRLLGSNATGNPGIKLAADVAAQLDNAGPNFSKYAGGQFEGLLLAQWSAWQGLRTAVETAIAAGAASEAEMDAARTETTAADEQLRVDVVDALVTLFSAFANNSAAQANITALQAELTQIDANDYELLERIDNACSLAAQSSAAGAGYTYKPYGAICGVAPDRIAGPSCADSGTIGGSLPTSYPTGWSKGPVVAQRERCDQARLDYEVYSMTDDSLRDSVQDRIDAAEDAILAADLVGHIQVPAMARLAVARWPTARAREAAAASNAAATIAAQFQIVQQEFSELMAAGAALRAAANQSELAKARIDLESSLESALLGNRFQLRRTFRSYDLWRARALSENARRLAVAARRAIESRFVVDLSAIKSPETFVEAPSLWADEIYNPDLKPPAAVGLTAAPTDTGGVYSSKLLDYVNNLELFVNGYAIGRPTATVRSDTEVVQLPGPAAIGKTVAGDGTVFEYRDVESGGWSFYCPDTGTWERNPQSAEFDPAAWTLDEMCGGEPPTRARLGFWLDPWGRPLGVLADPPFRVRHNARWRSFAVNLVGSGVRDCSRAADASACYAEPFIRYGLKHVGPAMVSNYDQSWVSMDIPTGVVEGGKALASEEWIDPVANGFQNPVVSNVARGELAGRPLGGAYELILELPPDVRPERIERIQVLFESDYWVRQQ